MYDALIILGSGVKPNGKLPKLGNERVEFAATLCKKAKHVICSGKGPTRHTKPKITEAKAMKKKLIELGVPAKKILLEEQSHSTLTNAYYCKALLCEPKRFRKLLISTSDFHMKRSKLIFQHVFGPNYTLSFSSTKHDLGLAKRSTLIWREFKKRVHFCIAKREL